MSEAAAAQTSTVALSGANLIREMGMRELMAEDYRVHGRRLFSPGLHAVWVNRIGTWAFGVLPRFVRFVPWYFYCFGFWVCRVVYGIEIAHSVKLGRRFVVGHQSAIVIHRFATFGDDCTVRQGVTLGISNMNHWREGEGPVIGNNVSFAVGAVVMGNVSIGDNVQIGPNCVVTSDIPADRVLFVPPPRILPQKTEDESEMGVS